MIFKVERIAMCIMHFCLEVGFCWCSRWNMSHRYSCITKLYIMFLSGRNFQSTTDARQSESHLKSVFCFREGVERSQNEKCQRKCCSFEAWNTICHVFCCCPSPWSIFPEVLSWQVKSKKEVQWLEVLGSWGWLKKSVDNWFYVIDKGIYQYIS